MSGRGGNIPVIICSCPVALGAGKGTPGGDGAQGLGQGQCEAAAPQGQQEGGLRPLKGAGGGK